VKAVGKTQDPLSRTPTGEVVGIPLVLAAGESRDVAKDNEKRGAVGILAKAAFDSPQEDPHEVT
jgi:hypothetical protein